MQHIFLIFSCLFAIINTPQWQMMPIVACRGFFCVRSEPLCRCVITCAGFEELALLKAAVILFSDVSIPTRNLYINKKYIMLRYFLKLSLA